MSAARASWSVRPNDPAAEEALARELAVSPLVARLLVARGLGDPELASPFLDASLSRSLRSPMLFREMRVAAGRLLAAVRNRERVFIYGDYDVDGITGATELLLFLREIGAVDPQLFIPNRFRDGYGLRAEPLRELASRGAKLLVTVDCGAAAHGEIALAGDLGIEVIVCDHHQAPEVRPPALAVLNPVVRDAGFPFAGLCAAGVAFYLMMGMRMLLRESGDQGPDLRRYLDLVALGTVADLVPLLEENRALVKYGLREIARRDRPGIHALLEVSGVDAVTVSSLGFGLGPRINASGRLADATSAVELLASRDPATARRLAVALDGQNRDRRALEQAIYEEADRRIQAMSDREGRRSFVLASEGWHSGVVGIVASRLVERYYRPVVLLAIENGWCRGSARGIPGVHLFEALQRCSAFLERFGGHRMAAGLTVREEHVADLAKRFDAVISSSTSAEDFRPVISVDATVRLGEVTPEVVDDLARLEPHGPGNPRPVLCVRGVTVAAARIVGERHLRLDLRIEDSARTIEAIGFRLAERVTDARGEIDILFSPELNVWEGRERLQLLVRDFKKTE